MMMPLSIQASLLLAILLLFNLPMSVLTQNDDKEIHIGAILSNPSHAAIFSQLVGNMTAPDGYTYRSVAITATNNTVNTATDICDHLLPKQVVTVLFEVSAEHEKFMTSVPFTLEFYKIPVIGLSSRSSVLSNTYAHPYFLRTLPARSFEAELWFNTLRKEFKYNKVIFLYSNDVEGITTLNVFRNLILRTETAYGEKSFEISKLVMLQPYETNFTADLQPILSEDARVILLAVGSEIASYVYDAAAPLGILGPSWVWLVSEQAASVPNIPQGVLSWETSPDVLSPTSHMEDALRVVDTGIRSYLSSNTGLGTVPNSCSLEVQKENIKIWDRPSLKWWQPGIDLYELYTDVSFRDGETGIVKFSDSGDRMSINYILINQRQNNTKLTVGNFSTQYNVTISKEDDIMNVYEDQIIWPGNQFDKPVGVNVSKHLRVVTIEETPFIYTEPYDPIAGCNASQRDDPSSIARMRCPKHLPNGTAEYCCYGYLIDMLDMLRINMSVTFSLHLVEDNDYGTQVSSNISGKTQWNGMMGELLAGKADMIVAPFVINPERAKYVEFTKPFKFLGITILVKKNPKKSSLGSFLQPFQKTLWFLVVVSVHVIALVLYLLDRFSPFGQLQLARETDSEDALSLSTAIWFAWGVLLNSGIGEGTPKSFSARVLGMVWAGFAMIIVASYTANLAAFLVLDKPEASISGIDDPRLRNPTDTFKFATVKNSAIEEYFKRQVEFTTMYRTMENQNLNTVEEAIFAVENGSLQAFIWDSPRLIYEATKKCNLVTAGELFGRSSYGIAFKKNSHWTDEFSLQILSYHEVGRMEKYDNKWIMNSSTTCEQGASSPATLGLSNMAGVFIMVAIGIGIGFVILLIEIGYSKYENMKEKQNNIAKKAVARWKRYVQRRKALRKTWALIKDINETDSVSEEEARHRIREYLEQPPSRTPSVASFQNNIQLGETSLEMSDLPNGSRTASNGLPPSPLPILLQPSSAGAQKYSANPSDCTVTINDSFIHPDGGKKQGLTTPHDVTTPNEFIAPNNTVESLPYNRSSSGSVTPTISIVPPVDKEASSPYSTRDGEVRHNPIFIDS